MALVGAVVGLLAGGVLLAAPAAAIDDPARPDSRVTHGPSCRPGGVVVEVTAGTVPYAVTLATTRLPGGEDSAELQPGQLAVLRTGDVAWGERVDSRLEFAALDGSGTTYVDELEGFEFTRPAEEDCAAIAPAPGAGDLPVAEAVPPPAASSASPEPGTGPSATPEPAPREPAAPSGVVPEPDVVPLPVPRLPAPGTAADVPADGGNSPGSIVVASAETVAAGDAVTLTGDGFEPGEVVTVRVAGGRVLAEVPAGPDGGIEATVRVPGGTAPTTTLELEGTDSDVTAAVELRLAAAAGPVDPAPVSVPLVVAGLALVGSVTGLALTTGRRRRPSAAGPQGPVGDSGPAGPAGSA